MCLPPREPVSTGQAMAANRVGRRYNHKVHSPNRGPREPGLHLQKRQARVTVKYNRKELQKRLDVEKWIDDRLAELYLGRVSSPTESDPCLLDGQGSNRSFMLLVTSAAGEDQKHSLPVPRSSVFVKELMERLQGLQKQEELQNDGIEHPH
nr:PREDICTED: protein phosphatase 1 regulatory subunit 14A-like [Lepisosteus oculatus]